MPLVWDELFRVVTETPAGLAGWPMTAVLAFSVKGLARTEFRLGRLRFLIWRTSYAADTWACPYLEAAVAVPYYLTDLFVPTDFEAMGLLTLRLDAARVLTVRRNAVQRGQTVVEDVPEAAWADDLPLGVSMSQTMGETTDAVLRVAHMAIFNTALSDTDVLAVETMLAKYSGVTL